ncbi:hypothetical protein M378DRAFT_319187 [Amanita muscaria Koide BX008]|uniref:Uncharacterized protein n=1 Tax=Amanita muscaria (strain Koide BX008) TaxID=946122 RepID=A0A0C2SW50_AMAMK|nr:hypothetical protein M378DRAFT_319187 [Amanita muscaria Koide BX008]
MNYTTSPAKHWLLHPISSSLCTHPTYSPFSKCCSVSVAAHNGNARPYHNNNCDMPPFSPVAPVGSPSPFPYTHARRQAYPYSANNNALTVVVVAGGGGAGAGRCTNTTHHTLTKPFSANNALNNGKSFHKSTAGAPCPIPPFSSIQARLCTGRTCILNVCSECHLIQCVCKDVLVTSLFHFLVGCRPTSVLVVAGEDDDGRRTKWQVESGE